MRIVPTVLGGLLLVLTFHDLVATTVSVSGGAGPVTQRVGHRLWHLALRTRRRNGRRALLRRSGPLILFLVIALWTVLLILGWALVFGQESIVTIADGAPAGFLGNVYFSAATVTGVGSATLATDDNAWQFVEQLAAISGLALVGLSISYVIPVVQAVVEKRRIGAYVDALGRDAVEALERSWNGSDLGHLDLHLIALTQSLAGLGERYLAYPIVHYFHSTSRRTAIGPAVATLDAILVLNRHALADEIRLEPSVTDPLERCLWWFLEVAAPDDVEPVGEPSWPDLATLRRAGVPLTGDDPLPPLTGDLRDRQERILGYLAHDGWAVEEVRQATA
jgi:hypothetical protein